MQINIAIVAGVSVTAAVAATSLIDRTIRREKPPVVAKVKPERTAVLFRKASQETPFVVGNMVLATL